MNYDVPIINIWDNMSLLWRDRNTLRCGSHSVIDINATKHDGFMQDSEPRPIC